MAKRRLASISTHYSNRLERLRRDFEATQDDRIQLMRRSELERVQNEFKQRKDDIESRLDADIVSTRVATGILVVREAQRNDG
jgi:hypothetical protein